MVLPLEAQVPGAPRVAQGEGEGAEDHGARGEAQGEEALLLLPGFGDPGPGGLPLGGGEEAEEGDHLLQGHAEPPFLLLQKEVPPPRLLGRLAQALLQLGHLLLARAQAAGLLQGPAEGEEVGLGREVVGPLPLQEAVQEAPDVGARLLRGEGEELGKLPRRLQEVHHQGLGHLGVVQVHERVGEGGDGTGGDEAGEVEVPLEPRGLPVEGEVVQEGVDKPELLPPPREEGLEAGLHVPLHLEPPHLEG